MISNKSEVVLDKKEKFISQIPVSDKTSEYIRLITFLKERDYKITYYLQDIKQEDRYVAIVVDNKTKDVFGSNVTCMACWCKNGTRMPLNVQEFIDNYDEFVVNNNVDEYERMIRQKAIATLLN